MSLKNKIINTIASHPKLVTFGIGLAITFVVGTAIGMLDHNQAFAANGHSHNGQSITANNSPINSGSNSR